MVSEIEKASESKQDSSLHALAYMEWEAWGTLQDPKRGQASQNTLNPEASRLLSSVHHVLT